MSDKIKDFEEGIFVQYRLLPDGGWCDEGRYQYVDDALGVAKQENETSLKWGEPGKQYEYRVIRRIDMEIKEGENND